jgi:amidase
MTSAPGHGDATDLAAAIRSGETSSLAAIDATLVRADDRAALGAIRRLEPDLGRAGAAAFDDLLRRRSRRATDAPFGGVPFLMKDLGAAARGLAPTAGSRAIAARRGDPEIDDILVRRFRRAGLIPFGLTTSPEFGLSLTCEPPGGPIARNPFDESLSPGGSSGGAAAAVAAGIVAIAHATDAAGSIRVPAAACGLHGLKPTRGAIPGGPGFGNHLMGLAGELVVARSLRDLGAALTAASGDAAGPVPDPDLDAVDSGTDTLRIAVVEDAPAIAGISTASRQAVQRAADCLADAGHRVRSIGSADLADLARRANAVTRAVLSVSLAAWLDGVEAADAEISPMAAAVRREGRATSGPALYAAVHDGTLVAHALWRVFEHHDVVLTAMLSDGPPVLGAMPMDHKDTDLHWSRMAEIAPYAALANVGGVPALSVPIPWEGQGPGSVQLIGPMGSDRLLLSLAEDLATSAPFCLPWSVAGLA